MKKTSIKTMLLAAAMLTSVSFVSCRDENNETVDDELAAQVAEQFVDHTVAPTYTTLAAKAELLADQLAALRRNATDAGVEAACQTFLDAREQWEKSEAFLFGAASDFGIDPHIDSWPLDEDAFRTLMYESPAMIAALDGEDGDVVAGERLGNALLGFHGLEYILFADGRAKKATDITENEWIYAAAVAGDLRNRCYQLEVGWLGDKAPESHVAKLEELEMTYTVAGGNYSYGENMKNAGKPGSTYASRIAALMAMVQGCSDIADEVGSSKIYAAWHGEDITYIESPYSQKSIVDFYDNILSIRNVYMGGVEDQRNESKSLHDFVKKHDASIDGHVTTAIENALAKINAMPAPFVLHYADAANGVAVEACAELSDALAEINNMLREL